MRDQGGVPGMAARAGLVADGLGLGRRVDLWSLVLVVLALVGLTWAAWLSLLWPSMLLLLSVLAAGAQKGLALRVAFDEAVFRTWAARWHDSAIGGGDAEGTTVDDLQAFDQGLAVAGLRKQAGGPMRDLDSRLRGATKLFGRQLLAFVLQFATLLASALAVFLQPSA